MRKTKKRYLSIGAVLMSLSLILQGAGSITSLQAADKQIKVRSQSQTQMSSEPEVVYVNSYNDTTVRTQNFDSNWKFYLGEAGDAHVSSFDDSKWRQLSLPHDYSIEQEYSRSMEAESGYLPGGTGWYRKSFTVGKEMEGKELRIDFGGVYMNATIWVNGEQLGTHPFGYTPFSFDITDYVNYGGDNVIAVKVEHRTPSSRWYSGSGIYRSVNLTVMDKVHVGLYGTKVETPNLEAEQGGTVNMNVKATIANESEEAVDVSLIHTIYEKGSDVSIGTVTTDATEIGAGESADIEAVLPAENPELWSTENPALYTVRTEVKVGDAVVDTYDTEYGFRYIAFDTETGFYLNGENVKLKGVCMHHDQGALGSAAYRRAIERQVEILKEMGCNSIRVTHNPAADELIEICNEKGILVIDEFFDGWMYPKNGNSNDYSVWFNRTIESGNEILGSESGMTWAEFDLKATANRGKNAPSIIMWSLGNEIQEGAGGSGYNTKAVDLIKWTEEVDTTKLLTIGSNAVKNGASEHIDIANQLTAKGGVSGTNYSNGSSYDSLHSRYPNWRMVGSETASSVNSRGIYSTKANNSLNANKQLTSYDKSAVGWGAFASAAWYDVITRDFVAGEYVWTGFDYIGEPTPANGTGAGAVTSWPSPKSSYFGIVDTAGLPKDSYYFYQSQWNDEVNTLHVLPAWNEDVVVKSGNNVEVVVYSDAAAVELFLNGESLGKKAFTQKTTQAGYTYQIYEGTGASYSTHQNLYLTWNVPFAEGTLEAVAYDADGNVIEDTQGRSIVKTTGEEAKLEAAADRTEIKADGKDLSYITVDVTDADGNIVPDADDRVTFTVEGDGELVGVDNGSSPDHDSYKADNRKAFSGKLVAIIKATKNAGNITVTATAEGLEPATVEITTTPVDTGAGAQKEISSFYMAKNYYVKAGNMPELPAQIEARYMDGSEELKDVVWDEVTEDQIGQTGTFTVSGLVDGMYVVSVNVNMIDDIGGLLNYSSATPVGVKPVIPETRPAVMPDGTVLATAFAVEWEEVDDSVWNEIGEVVINGTANVLGQDVAVTATIRVANESITIGDSVSGAAYLTQDIPEDQQSDTLDAIKDGSTTISDNSGGGANPTAWSNWSAAQAGDTTAEITFRYDTQQRIGRIVIHFAKDSGSMRYPDAGTTEIYISETGEEGSWTKVEATETIGAESNRVKPYTYDFAPITATFVRFDLVNSTATTGTQWKPCTAITEIELLKAQGAFVANTTAKLGSLSVNGLEIAQEDLAAGSYVTAASYADVEAKGADNASVTVLPAVDDVIRIIIESEDHNTRNMYEIMLNGEVKPLTGDYPVEKLTAIADSQYSGNANEGPASYVLDGDGETHWHTNWSTSEAADVEKRWIGLELEEAAAVSGIRYLPRTFGGNNGAVTEYKIQYRENNDGEWTDVATGTWSYNDSAWKEITFAEPVMAKQVRVVGVHTWADSGNDKHMSTAEMRVTVPETVTDITDEANGIEASLVSDTIKVAAVDEAHPVLARVNVTKDGVELYHGEDYVVTYENNTAYGEAVAIITGIRYYSGQIRLPFTIAKIDGEDPGPGPSDVDKSDLAALIEYANGQKASADYEWVVPGIKALFEDALEAAEVVNADAQATAEEVDAAYDALLAKVHLLSYLGADKGNLADAIERAENIDTSIYTKETADALKDALAKAKEVDEDENALADEIEEARTDLINAINGLVLNPVNKDALKALIAEANGYLTDGKEYTKDTREALEIAVADAQAIVDDNDATQDEVDGAYRSLRQVIFGLRLVPDKGVLEGLLNNANAINLADYTEESAAAVKAATAFAQKVMEDENATAKEVEEAEEALRAAMEGLKVADAKGSGTSEKGDDKSGDNSTGKVAGDNTGKTNTTSQKGVAKTGDSVTVMPIIAILLIAAVAMISSVTIKRKRR